MVSISSLNPDSYIGLPEKLVFSIELFITFPPDRKVELEEKPCTGYPLRSPVNHVLFVQVTDVMFLETDLMDVIGI